MKCYYIKYYCSDVSTTCLKNFSRLIFNLAVYFECYECQVICAEQIFVVYLENSEGRETFVSKVFLFIFIYLLIDVENDKWKKQDA